MAKLDLKLLDCTLRDGGYVNEWKWGFNSARSIISYLTKARVDVVEVGFLRNVEGYNPDVTVCNHIEDLNKLLPENIGDTMYSAMAMRSNYDITKLSPYSGKGIEMIRITAHDYDIAEGMDFARQVKALGYKLSINPINIMGYSDERILWIIDQVNQIQPYQFAIVDTFGSMKRRDLDRIVSLVDNNLDRSVRVALHLHENMALSCCLAQNYVDKHLNRPVAIDGSLMGMGRIPGNLPIELIADYLNDYTDKAYDIDYLMDAIQDHIAPIKGQAEWGYTPAYFLSARFNLHRNYAEHYLKKGDLTCRDINHLLSRFDKSKKTAFDAAYADNLYEEYKNNRIDDSVARAELQKVLSGKEVLVLAPGKTITTHTAQIESHVEKNHPIVIAVNFIPAEQKVDFVFISNARRYQQTEEAECRRIITSNVNGKAEFVLDYNGLSGAFEQGCNSYIMLLKLLSQMGVTKIASAGADGYRPNEQNYASTSMRSETEHDVQFNNLVKEAIRNLNVSVKYITPSAYE